AKYTSPKDWNGNNFPAGKARFPVTDVNWDAANAYAKWAGKRLPTEAEWEFAARGTSGLLYSWGNEWKDGLANADNINRGMVAVGSYQKGASPFGIYDLIGNAWEWTATTLEPYPNGAMPAIAEAKKNVEFKIIRGGSWSNNKEIATTTRRGFYGAREENSYSNTGFRCVKD
ncbi:MAG: formylglycine-generating enzyme family protein, partial [Pyrinomonadaceae bacterium]|nr:formylglycine-generating enzyme family protein [Pyrinomonadaceae bacterium]